MELSVIRVWHGSEQVTVYFSDEIFNLLPQKVIDKEKLLRDICAAYILNKHGFEPTTYIARIEPLSDSPTAYKVHYTSAFATGSICIETAQKQEGNQKNEELKLIKQEIENEVISKEALPFKNEAFLANFHQQMLALDKKIPTQSDEVVVAERAPKPTFEKNNAISLQDFQIDLIKLEKAIENTKQEESRVNHDKKIKEVRKFIDDHLEKARHPSNEYEVDKLIRQVERDTQSLSRLGSEAALAYEKDTTELDVLLPAFTEKLEEEARDYRGFDSQVKLLKQHLAWMLYSAACEYYSHNMSLVKEGKLTVDTAVKKVNQKFSIIQTADVQQVYNALENKTPEELRVMVEKLTASCKTSRKAKAYQLVQQRLADLEAIYARKLEAAKEVDEVGVANAVESCKGKGSWYTYVTLFEARRDRIKNKMQTVLVPGFLTAIKRTNPELLEKMKELNEAYRVLNARSHSNVIDFDKNDSGNIIQSKSIPKESHLASRIEVYKEFLKLEKQTQALLPEIEAIYKEINDKLGKIKNYHVQTIKAEPNKKLLKNDLARIKANILSIRNEAMGLEITTNSRNTEENLRKLRVMMKGDAIKLENKPKLEKAKQLKDLLQENLKKVTDYHEAAQAKYYAVAASSFAIQAEDALESARIAKESIEGQDEAIDKAFE
ncbi:MAG: hypothetical protein EPO11_01290, partial [Gammaproteobacteria bacterium]